MKKFAITFKENSKYNPMTRTVQIEGVPDEATARFVFATEFDSIVRDKKTFAEVPSGKRVTIKKIKEVKKKKEKV
jgi:hypothetical protein